MDKQDARPSPVAGRGDGTRSKINNFANEIIGFMWGDEFKPMTRADAHQFLTDNGEYTDWVWNRSMTTLV
jgi:hypothetical protein